MYYSQIATSPEIYEIKTPVWNDSFLISCYAIHDSGQWLLIDMGMPQKRQRELLRAALKEIGFDWSKAQVALTHLHLDHGGMMTSLTPAGTKVFVGSRELAYVRTTRSLSYAQKLVKAFGAEGFSRSDSLRTVGYHWVFATVKESRQCINLVKEGDIIAVGNLRFEVIDTAGHSAGHVSYFEQTHGLLFGGDHMLFYMLPSIAWLADGSDTVAAYLSNTSKLLSMPITRFFVAHGENKPEFRERLQETTNRHEMRLNEFVAAVESKPGQSGLDVVKQIVWLDEPKAYEDIDTFTRCCILCEGLASLNHLVLTGRIRRVLEGKRGNRYYPAE